MGQSRVGHRQAEAVAEGGVQGLGERQPLRLRGDAVDAVDAAESGDRARDRGSVWEAAAVYGIPTGGCSA